MTHPHRVVAVVGSTSERSRTQVLVEALAASLAERAPVEVETFTLRELAPHIGTAVSRDTLGPLGARALDAIERADLLIVATPVYKGSYTGLLKHLIDFVPPDALVGRPVLLAATGGSDRHALVVDHTLRPLFSFFRALTVPSAVYAAESDFAGFAVKSPQLQDRIAEAAAQAASLLRVRAASAAEASTATDAAAVRTHAALATA